ncbi:stage VI sporulation protein F [Salicibibacter halophilus]|uniref:Stage VI sporulation protein F n=1 Tax=Salicibibacter halophilus TaxID=2502791 RepID=A0A514LDL0_9BACI|nr:stage VI sporulation protein F [Salicibibacter halophilus]QDI89939.1 stage VI sporulation protein F [Salicibibacter halophilus]
MYRDDSIFDHIQKNTSVDQDDVQNMASAAQGADFQDEESVRQLIHEVAQMAGVRVPKEKEEYLVHAIINNQVPLDFASLSELFRD